MSTSHSLRQRLDDVDAVLVSARKLERSEQKSKRGTLSSARSIASIRASAYVMLYNSIEYSVRASMAELRTQIQQEKIHFSNAREFWRLDCIQSRFLERMSSGTNHGNVLTQFVPLTDQILQWEAVKLNRLPGSGNFGQDTALYLKKFLPLDWTPPPRTAGGVDLESIRTRRNDLAHGFETFEVVGSQVTTLQMFEVTARTRNFMISFIDAIDRYRKNQGYIQN